MKINVFQKGFNYSQDGFGNRLVYHLQGCNLRCPWCANPEGMTLIPPLVVKESELLDEACPHGAIKDHHLNRALCEGCISRECVNIHRHSGIVCKEIAYEVEDLVAEAKGCSAMFFDHGGVTFTGGEPTVQFDGLMEVLTRLKEEGIHTALETNGTHPRLGELFPVIDQLMMDFKHYDSDKHRSVTGLGNENARANIQRAAGEGKELFIRIPLIGGFNASLSDIPQFIDFFQDIQTCRMCFEFLSYHEYGRDKWKACGWEYTMKDAFVPEETVKAFRQGFIEKGLRVIRT